MPVKAGTDRTTHQIGKIHSVGDFLYDDIAVTDDYWSLCKVIPGLVGCEHLNGFPAYQVCVYDPSELLKNAWGCVWMLIECVRSTE